MANVNIELGYKPLVWFTANPTIVLLAGQIVYLEQTGTYKIGDGVTQLSVLSFLGISSETQTLQNVTDLGSTTTNAIDTAGITTDYVQLDLTAVNTNAVGKLIWNNTDGTLDLGLKGGNVTLQIGQETVARVVNKTGTNITLLESNYQAVRVTGAIGQRPKVDLALANNDLNSATTLGLVTETILNNAEGFINTSGQVREINTTGSLQGETWLDGDILYLSGTVAGQITNIKPFAPIHTVIIGFVEYAHAIHGKIFVKVNNGYELEELHNVSAIAPNNNEVLTYDTATLLWKPKTVSTALGYTPYNATNPSGYITSSALTPYALIANPTFTTAITTPIVNGVSGNLAFANAIQTSGAITSFTFTKPNNTNQTLSTSIAGFNYVGGTRQWATGAITTQSENVWGATTYSFVGASTITNAYGNVFNAPIAGTNATITNNWAAQFNGNVVIGSTGQLIEIKQTTNLPALTMTGTTGNYFNLKSGTRNLIFENYSADINFFSASGATFRIRTTDSNNIQLATNNVNRFTIGFDGNFYVNDTSNFVLGTTTGNKIGTTTTQKIAFWNATPIVQPTTSVTASTFVSNTSAILNDTATFDGYTIGQVVKALRNMGLLA
jgi:hypothetical protein